MEIREFRGYIKGKLEYTFPLHWVDSMEWTPKGIEVTYDNEMKYDTENQECVFDTILVDSIDVK